MVTDVGGPEELSILPAGALPPALVSLTSFSPLVSPSPRRLSSNFSQPASPVPAARKRLAWVSLQGRLVDAEEASSAEAIGGGLSRQEALAWELFTPIHRILIVAVIAVAAAESKKNRHIWKLRKSLQLRDQVLSSMQQKLDSLCEQMNNITDQKEVEANRLSKNVEYGCWLCDQHQNLSNDFRGNLAVKAFSGDEMFKHKMPFTNEAGPEERRMSDFSDWASSTISAAETQMNGLAVEQDIFNLKRECEEKDATIKELSNVLHSSSVAGSKRITELEDIIRRKNQTITRFKKDLVILEQKVVHLTRLRRSSFHASSSNTRQLPFMTDNLIYDMDSSTSPSSDSDCPSKKRTLPPPVQLKEIPDQNSEVSLRREQKSTPARGLRSSMRQSDQYTKSQPVTPLGDKSMNRRSDSVSSLKPKQLSEDGVHKKRRPILTRSKEATPHKKWA